MEVSAQLNNFRKSARKIRLAAKVLKGLDAEEAQNQLKFLVKGSAPALEKLLKSAVANAQNNFGLDKDNLFVKSITVNEGPRLKRWLPRAHGRASLILKKTSNIEMILAEKVEGKGRKKIEKQGIKDVKMEDLAKEKEEKGKKPASAKAAAGKEEAREEKKEAMKEREQKEFLDEKKKTAESKGFLKKVFRRKSI